MFSVTPTAIEHLNSMIGEAGVGEEQALRLIHQGGGQLGLTIDSSREGDQVEKGSSGRTVLVIEQELVTALDGSTLDAVNTDSGTQLSLVGPAAGTAS